jgi:uncharacterized protein
MFIASLLVFLLVQNQAQAQSQIWKNITLVTAKGERHVFKVETASNDEERARGLMFRRHMEPDQGMLFDFENSQILTMWMKNTYLSLDMIFLDDKGVVTKIVERTEPLSTRIISSQYPARGVLEVIAGTAARLKLQTGDRIEPSPFRP